jgi:hypothetical protein
VDGAAVAASYTANGPVGSVGPHGIAVGHWPEVSGQYTFAGYIREAWVYKYDPTLAGKSLMNSCCDRSRPALDDIAATLRTQGYTAQKARAQGMDLIKFGLSISAKVRGSYPARSHQHATLSANALGAFQRGDSPAYTTALTELAAMAATTLSAADQQAIHAKQAALLKELPLPLKDWQSLIGNLCMGGAKADPKAVLAGVTQALGGKQTHSSKKRK